MESGRWLKTRPGLAAIAAVALALASCGGAPVKPAAATHTLTDTIWELQRLEGRAVEVPVQWTVPWIDFMAKSGEVRGSAGCNRFGGGYTVDGRSLDLSRLYSTKIFCRGVMAVEDAFTDALIHTASYAITDGALVLYGANDEPLARLVPHDKR